MFWQKHILFQGHRKLFYGGRGGGEGGLSKNSSHHGSPTTKVYKKEHWLKHPKVVPKKKNWTYI